MSDFFIKSTLSKLMIQAAEITSSRQCYQKVASLLLYQSIFDNEIGQRFLDLLQTLYQGDYTIPNHPITSIDCLKAYGSWFHVLAQSQQSWQDYLIRQILWNDNPFTQQVQTQSFTKLSPALLIAVKHDLQILQYIYQCSPEKISNWIKIATQMPEVPIPWNFPNYFSSFLHKSPDWTNDLATLANHCRHQGTGFMAQYKAFQWQDNQLRGIAQLDAISWQEIYGCESQKQRLQQNTEFLLAGYPSLNVLLYGSRGSGKSSLVKGLLPKYQSQGLRLIEVSKTDLDDLPKIVETVQQLPQKFILFVDDLSFEEDDDTFKGLKAILEGSLTTRPLNMVVYATSNRRHLIREFFSDRPMLKDQEEVHAWDTLQEKLSFSDRFGLTLTFEPINQETYLKIVHHLAQEKGINLKQEELEFRAKQWTKQYNNRSGRTARQFIDFLYGEMQTKINSI